MHTEPDAGAHLTPGQAAGYVDRTLAREERRSVMAHLVGCAECRREVIEIARVVTPAAAAPRWRLFAGGMGVAAAAIGMLLLWPGGKRAADEEPAFRDSVTNEAAPIPIEPVGATSRLTVFRWTSIPQANRYRLTLFDSAGMTRWELDLSDTAVTLPDSLRLAAGQSYFWKVEARTRWDHWVSSGLIEFATRTEPGAQ